MIRDLFLEMSKNNPFNWFNKEMRIVLGIDVFTEDFPKDKGYKIFRGKHPDLLLIRLENLNQCAQKAFKEFLGIPKFSLVTENLAQDRKYNQLYQQFISAKFLPISYTERIYTSEVVRHFYTEEEIASFRKKWELELTLEDINR